MYTRIFSRARFQFRSIRLAQRCYMVIRSICAIGDAQGRRSRCLPPHCPLLYPSFWLSCSAPCVAVHRNYKENSHVHEVITLFPDM